MTIVPNQYFGIGDVIFTVALVRKIADGLPIVWPVMPHFVEGLNRAYPDIRFVDYATAGIDHNRKDQYTEMHRELGAITVLPLRWADVLLRVPYNDCMRAKYDLYGLDYEMWREGAMWVRGNEIEPKAEPYTLTNMTFGSDCNMNINIPASQNEVIMTTVSGKSLFDWAKVIENATAIHTVNTSIIYLLEMLNLRAPEIHLYQRPIAGQTFDNIKYILKRHKYVFHG